MALVLGNRIITEGIETAAYPEKTPFPSRPRYLKVCTHLSCSAFSDSSRVKNNFLISHYQGLIL